MTIDSATDLLRAAVMSGFILGGPILLAAVVVGLLISILQAVTQLQDQTLSFVPKIITMMVVLILLLPWLIDHMVEYSTDLYQNIPAATAN